MDKGEEALQNVLKKIKGMSVESYNKLYESLYGRRQTMLKPIYKVTDLTTSCNTKFSIHRKVETQTEEGVSILIQTVAFFTSVEEAELCCRLLNDNAIIEARGVK